LTAGDGVKPTEGSNGSTNRIAAPGPSRRAPNGVGVVPRRMRHAEIGGGRFDRDAPRHVCEGFTN
jgi:hypothetical protein